MVSGSEKLKDPLDEQDSAAAEIGKMFFEERTRKKLTIADVAEELRIRQLYLNCIESGDLGQLPGYVYVVGFIKSYANFLELDQAEIFRRLNLNSKPELTATPYPQSIPIHQQQSPSLKVLFASLTLLFIFGFSIYILKHVNLSEKLPPQETETPEGRAPINKYISSHTKATNTEITPNSLKTNNLTAPVSHDTNEKKNNIEATSKAEEIVSPPSPNPDMVKKIEEKTTLETSKPTPVQPQPTTPKAEAVVDQTDKITIVASKDSWVQVLNTKGESIFVRLMHKGETFDVPPTTQDNEHYILNTGNGGGVKFLMNGVETPALDHDGKVVRGVVLNQAHVKKMLQTPSNDPATAPSIKAVERVE